MNRRRFLIGCAAGTASGGLLVGWAARAPDLLGARETFDLTSGETALNGWVRIAGDGTVTVAVPRAEMGQGISSALAALVAEELDVAWERIRVEMPAQDTIYANTTMLVDGMALLPAPGHGRWGDLVRQLAANGVRQLGIIGTGGSASVRDGWLPMRTAGAAARRMLLQAAARRWQVDEAACSTRQGQVLHAASARALAYGELAPDAARHGLQGVPQLRAPDHWRLIGKTLPRLDMAVKVSGAAIFGIDAAPPQMLHAAVRMAPYAGAEASRFDADAVLAEPGIEAVVKVPGGVAVVAKGWWQAHRAAERMQVEFAPPAAALDTDGLLAQYRELAEHGHAHLHEQRGDQHAARLSPAGEGGMVLQRDYLLPFQAHATMEPMNCTARVAGGHCEVWMGHQIPTFLRWFAAEAAGVSSDQVSFHAAQLGGGFGRRAEVDLVVQAVTVAARLAGRPVKLIWTRADDLRHDCHRPMALVRVRVATDAHGLPLAWQTRIVGPSVLASMMSRLLPAAATDAMPDKMAVDGAIDMPYAVPALRGEHVPAPPGLPVGIWRSVGHSINAFAVEAMIDELATRAGRDPLHYREALLAGQLRHLAVLRALAHASGWDQPLPVGRARGMALHACFGSVLGQVAEIERHGARWRVVRVFAVVDCGSVIDPDTVRAQVEGGILWGLAAAAHTSIHLAEGGVRESNFHDFAILRMADTPEVQVLILEAPGDPPGGIGEVGVPPLAPALAAALRAATGRMQFSLPLDLAATPSQA
ncbi:MAG: xanthine dehydrogenase family protein molybdopterin-binding subunit [Pseudomonadota bacterium]|nr:xanthine dehydrogenase family protein molybdopterin-binding subunit [Pseudomonadota bacterium]